MIDHNSPTLVFEHKLRQHIETQRARADKALTMMQENASVYISFNSSNKWVVSAYVKAQDIVGKAAQLIDAVDIFINAVYATVSKAELPALLPPPAPAPAPASVDATEIGDGPSPL